VTFDFLYDVFLLYLPLEAAKCVFKRLPLLNSNFRQKTTPPCSPELDLLVMASLCHQVKWNVKKTALGSQKRKRSDICTWRGAYALVAFMKLVGC
jgi:hypothetical protein